MKKFILLLMGSISFFNLFAQTNNCFEISSIHVDGCGGEENEFVTLKTGENDLSISNMNIAWSNNTAPWLGICQNENTAQITNQINQSITSCGFLIEPLDGIIPANSKVFLMAKENFDPLFYSFEYLVDTAYVLFHCSIDDFGHFANFGSSPRYLSISFGSDTVCTDNVSYLPDSLPGGDGGVVYYNSQGNASYGNDGCVFNEVSINPSWNHPTYYCESSGLLDLSSLISGDLGGSWSGAGVNGNYFNPIGLSGEVVITYSIGSTTACTVSETHGIIVVPSPTITYNGPTSICFGENVALSTNIENGVNYQWALNGVNIIGATEANYNATTSGSYTVIASVDSSCASLSNNIDVIVNPSPEITLTSIPSFISIQSAPIQINGSPAGGTLSGEGVSGTNFVPSLAGLGLANVLYEYTNSAGCSGTIIQSTIVYDTTGIICNSYETIFDTIYTIINDTITVSVEDTLIIETLILSSNIELSNEIKVYPNPAHSFLEIDNGNFSLMTGYSIRIDNSLGQVIFNQEINQQQFSINLSTWTGNGIYFLSIIDENGFTQVTRKIVLQ